MNYDTAIDVFVNGKTSKFMSRAMASLFGDWQVGGVHLYVTLCEILCLNCMYQEIPHRLGTFCDMYCPSAVQLRNTSFDEQASPCFVLTTSLMKKHPLASFLYHLALRYSMPCRGYLRMIRCTTLFYYYVLSGAICNTRME